MDDKTLTVPMVDLKEQYATIKTEIDEAIARVVGTQQFINGPDVAELEEEMARYCGVEQCIGVSSGTDALLVSLMALDIGPGDEVITTPYTFFATVGAIVRVGATPVFVDIDRTSFNLDPAGIEVRVTPRTRAIIPVHLFGQCAEMGPILEIARRHRLAVIEDAAQAIGAEYQGRRAGAMGTAGCFSFFPAKNLGAFGDGGAVVTNDRALAEKVRCLRNHGSHPKYYHRLVGGNFRLDTLQAAILRVKLRHLDDWTAARQSRAATYTVKLRDAGLDGSCLEVPAFFTSRRVGASRHVFNQYVIRCTDRDAVRAILRQQKIATEVYYPVPLHLQECFTGLGYRPGDFPQSEQAALTTLALPNYPELTAAQQNGVVEGIQAYYGSAGYLGRRQAA
jgi:dTDP-4-amino-4,6-dideoxygalactose transaminase